jgi:peptidoglycan hydrolase-like protein with peptidoglycan-binding domain
MKGDTMMKKDDAMMMKGDTMMKKDLMSARQTEISDLQTLLIEKGYLVIPAGVAKGTFGPKTRAALIKFQKASGLNPSGYFGPLTKAKISAMKGEMMKGDTMMKKDDAMMMKATDTMIKTN